MTARFAVLLSIAALTGGCGGADGDGRFTTQLRPLNNSGVTGSAQLSREGNLLNVHISATGLTPNRIHEQRLHALETGSGAARCPSNRRGGLLRAQRAEDVYGSDVFPLEPFPTVGQKGRLDYDNTLELDEAELRSLEGRAVVLAGKRVRRRGARLYAPELPVACGVLSRDGDGGG